MKKISIKFTRTHIMLALIVFLIWISMCANKKEVKNGFFPSTEQIEQEQIEEMQVAHSDKGLITIDNGYLVIKK